MSKKLWAIFIFSIVFLLCCKQMGKDADYMNPPVLAVHDSGEAFVGSEICKECHLDIYEAHMHTAHFNTSAIASSENIQGNFDEGSNILALADITFEMLKRGDKFYVRGTEKESQQAKVTSEFDIVIGSGVKGQSYLAWDQDQLFQLQPSYYPPTDSWINSPGFPSSLLIRPINDGCLKCHVTFAENKDFSRTGNRYNRESMIYGIDCERCHRPAQKHVTFHRANPDIVEPRFMLKIDTLSRQRRLDACAQCHSGLRENIIKGNSFSYLTGEDLNAHSQNFYTGEDDPVLDVHGNQYGLLAASRCFLNDSNMDCSTCHDPHQNERGNLEYFNKKCTSCHGPESAICSVPASIQQTMSDNCIACHMPNSPSKIMSFQLRADSVQTPVYVRTHLIGIYSEDQWNH